MARISVVVNTLNEAGNLPYALRSVVGWADEVVVVDMHSDDGTVEVARAYGATIVLHERMGFVEPARRIGVERARGDWILLLDADEVVPAPLRDDLLRIAAGNVADVVVLPWRNYLLGAPLDHTGWGPDDDRHARFFKRAALSLPAEIHGPLQPIAGARVLRPPYAPGHAVVHFNYVNTEHFFEKLNRYTTIEAAQAEPAEDVRPRDVLARAAREFLWRYWKRRGYRDGWRGLFLSLYMATYRLAEGAKRIERQTVGDRDQIRARYARVAEELLAAHGEAARERTPRMIRP